MADDALARIEQAIASHSSSLSLAGLGLGSLPSAVGRLSELSELNLARNRLTILPDWIGNLTGLTHLNLAGNHLTAIPEWLGGLTDITNLSLRGNQLAELPDALGNLTRLADLDLTGNRLIDLPERIGDLAALTSLDLTGNLLRRLPASVTELVELVSLSLTRNQLTALPAEVGRLARLAHLHLAKNQLCELPDSIGSLSALTRLDLSDNNLAMLPASIGCLVALTRLDLGGNDLSELPGNIGNLPLLNRLEVTGNHLTELPESIGNLPLLNRLDVTGNHLTELPDSIGRMDALDYLVLADNHLDRLPACMTSLTGLIDLDLSRNQLTALPHDMGEMSALTYLNVTSNRMTTLPDSVGDLAALTYLNASGNQLSELPERLGELTALNQLDLSNNLLPAVPRSLALLDRATISLAGNPLAPELQAAYDEGPDEFRTFLRLLYEEGQFIREAKLVLVGEGAVGKSSLLAALRGEDWVPDRPTTHGVEIKPLVVNSEGSDLTLNGWDFGGQPAYRPTHQLFFSASAVYLVVWNPRVGPERNFVDYWISLIRHRAGRSARILVVATHGGVGQRGAYLDEAGLRARYGEMIAGFHHIDSRTRQGIDNLLHAIAKTAIALPHVGRWYPASWRTLRQKLQERHEPYLSYEAYESAALAHGMSRTAAISLARNANALGHWIYYADDQRLSDLVIFKPDWLSTAISFVLDDVETNRANGLLPHYRLPQLWNDPGRPAEQNYPPQIYPVFLQLMERFDISYQVIDRSGRGEPTSLIAQLVPAGRPDLAAWDNYHPEFETRSQICEIVEFISGDPAIPEGLMYQLIVRFHRFSLGRGDFRNSVHWQAGIILDDDYNGRAIITVERNRVQVIVRAPYPQFLLYRITQDIRDHVQSFWKGLDVRVMVPCGSECDEDPPGTGLFDVAKLIHSRERGRQEYPCSRCTRWQNIDQLLLGTPRAPVVDEHRLVQAVHEAMAPEFSEILRQISVRDRLAVGAVSREATEIKRAISQTEERYRNLILALDDEAREGPRLFSLAPLKPSLFHPGISTYSIKLTLWCEHSRLPLQVLNAGQPPTGVYEIDVPRDWLLKAAPWIKVTSVLIRNLLPVSLDGLKISLPERDWRVLADQLQLAEDSLDALTSFATAGEPDPNAPKLESDWPVSQVDGSLLRTVHAFLREKDPSFGGLERVRDRDRYRWVHHRFVSYYRPPPPVVPLQEPSS